jgi:hypothetical protein
LSLFVYIFQAAPTYVTPILTAEIVNIVTVSASVGMTQEALKQIIMYIIIIAVCILTNKARCGQVVAQFEFCCARHICTYII